MGRRPQQTFLKKKKKYIYIYGKQTHAKMFSLTHNYRNTNQNYNDIYNYFVL